MQWINEEKEFKKALAEARSCTYIDSGREDTNLVRLQFDDMFFGTLDWANLLTVLMEWANLKTIYFIILDPDPEYFFYNLYRFYPCVEFEKEDFPDGFVNALNRRYGPNESDKLMFAKFQFVVTSPSKPWFIHAMQSSDGRGGHLWVPKEWPQKIFQFNRNFIEAERENGSE